MKKTTSIFSLFLAVVFLGCSSEKDVTPTKSKLPKKVEKEKSKIDAKNVDIPDRIFGLPVPPHSFSHFTLGREEAVLTKLKLKDVQAFYKKNVVDYEILAQDNRVFVVGLRAFMPSAQAYYYTRRADSPTIVLFRKPQKPLNPTKYDAKGKIVKPKKGDPVKLLTEDGKLLAPGARWYEPYTPPIGSPLRKPRHKGNWGKPFGEWKNN